MLSAGVRLKLATHMGQDGGVYVLDEVTTGLPYPPHAPACERDYSR